METGEYKTMTQKKYLTPLQIPEDLLAKYNRSGPRYTSYPTAPQFSADIDINAVENIWKETNQSKVGLSFYTHFPFCRSRCLYCGCFTEVHHKVDTRDAYLEALKKEAFRLLCDIAPSRSLKQLAFGGGTPSYMKQEQLSEYIAYLRRLVEFSPDAELSLEIDPRSVDESYLEGLVITGFNRFSFGVQDLDPKVQKIIKRPLEEKRLQDLLDLLWNRGVEAINLDLIYGLPGQTSASFRRTIEKITDLRPSRIALFGYAHVPWVSPHQKALEKYQIPGPRERMILFGTAFEVLLQAGYEHVGMDHFALSGDDLLVSLKNRTLTRNFMGYTTKKGLDLIGIGASSISSVGPTYVQNEKDILSYINREEGLHWQKGLILAEEDLLRREIIIDFFCNFYLETSSIEKKWEISFADHFSQALDGLKPMEKDGLISINKSSLEVTQLGRFFIRNICMVFDQYLASEKTEGRYSKTV